MELNETGSRRIGRNKFWSKKRVLVPECNNLSSVSSTERYAKLHFQFEEASLNRCPLRLRIVSRKWNVHIQRTNFLSRNRSRAPWKFERPGLACISIRTIPDGIVRSEVFLSSIPIPSFQYQTKLAGELHPSKYHLWNANSIFDKKKKKRSRSFHSNRGESSRANEN